MPPESLSLSIAVPAFPRVSDWVGVWAMEPRAADALWRTVKALDLRQHIAESGTPERAAAAELLPANNGRSVAVVRLEGVLKKSASSTGGTSTVQARRDIRAAANNADVAAILLAIDSPGGTVAGTDDLAQEVRAAAKKKPVWAYASDLCASAAYWVASQCDAVYANSDTALVGSIGTLMTLYDASKAADAAGVETLVFATGPLKGAGTDGAAVSEEQRAYFQALVDDSQRAFDAAVQKGRRLTDQQLAGVRTGGVFGAAEAVDRKLIDGVQPFEAVLASLTKEANQRSRPAKSAEAIPPGATMNETIAPTAATPATTADLVAQQNAALAANLQRAADIQAVCLKHGQPAVAAQAIREGWSVEKAELAAMKAALPKTGPAANPAANPAATGPTVYTSGNAVPGVTAEAAIEAAIRMSIGSKVEADYKPEVLEAARQPQFRGIGLSQLFIMAAAEHGRHTRPGDRINSVNLREVLTYALDRGPSAAGNFSTVGLAGILGNIANKELLTGYVEEDDTWMRITQVKSVSNFQQVTSFRMLDNMEYEELGPNGEIKHGQVDQESYTRQAKTYAKMFALTRTQLINDDLGAFADIRTRLGRGSSKRFNRLFWTVFLNNVAFFTAGRTNYISGAATNLGTDGVGLGKGVLAFRKMTSPAADGAKKVNAGSGVGGRPSVLLVPPELEAAAQKLYVGENLNAGNAAGEPNIYRNKYEPVVAWQLSDPAYPGFSALAWYLLNDPKFLAAVVVSFLNGNMAPTVESASADFDQLGVQFRGYHDFGVDQAEYLAGLKSKGEA